VGQLEVFIYDTMSRGVIPVPNESGRVGIYVCGLTVYDKPHLGHARVFVVFDVLRRVLKANGYNVVYVQNFTDVDDRIITKAKETGLSTREVADKYIQAYFEDMSKLNVMEADVYPRATDHISDMLELIKKIEENGYAYTTSRGVYFRVSKFKDYGKLSHQSVENLKGGARIEPDPEKEFPLDFTLWKFYKGDPVEPKWDSAWGPGRPGWHIECSAMSMKYLGVIDVHGGGSDLIFPHHENEIAQSESATGHEFARSWMHVGLLNIQGEKMSKSLKNFITVEDAVNRWGGNAVRFFLLSSPYRSPLTFSEKAMDEAAGNWLQLEATYAEALCPRAKGEPPSEEFLNNAKQFEDDLMAALTHDLDTPSALASTMRYASYLARASAEDGLSKDQAEVVLRAMGRLQDLMGFALPKRNDEYERSVAERWELRENKRFAEADAIREQLKREGIILIDHRSHTVWFRSSVPDAVNRVLRPTKA